MATVEDNSIQTVQALKSAPAHAYVTLGLMGSGNIGVTESHLERKREEGATNRETFSSFVATLPDDQIAWIVYNFPYVTATGGQRLKVLLIRWVPARAGRRDKLQAAMWSSNVRRTIDFVHATVQATDLAEIDYAAVLQRAAKFERDDVDLDQE